MHPILRRLNAGWVCCFWKRSGTRSQSFRPGSVSSPLPTRALPLKTGDVLISDQFNMQVIEINALQNVSFNQGTIAVAGITFDLLNTPYDAKVVGDYTGITAPFADDGDSRH